MSINGNKKSIYRQWIIYSFVNFINFLSSCFCCVILLFRQWIPGPYFAAFWMLCWQCLCALDDKREMSSWKFKILNIFSLWKKLCSGCEPTMRITLVKKNNMRDYELYVHVRDFSPHCFQYWQQYASVGKRINIVFWVYKYFSCLGFE